MKRALLAVTGVAVMAVGLAHGSMGDEDDTVPEEPMPRIVVRPVERIAPLKQWSETKLELQRMVEGATEAAFAQASEECKKWWAGGKCEQEEIVKACESASEPKRFQSLPENETLEFQCACCYVREAPSEEEDLEFARKMLEATEKLAGLPDDVWEAEYAKIKQEVMQ